MNRFRANPWCVIRRLLAALAGVLLAMAFPKWGVAGLAWIAPGLLAGVALGRPGKERFFLGFLCGFAFALTSLSWLLRIPYAWHGIPFGPGAAWLALSAYVGLFPGAWAWLIGRLCGRVVSQGDTIVSSEAAGSSSWRQWAGRLLAVGLWRTWTGRVVWALLGAAAWVALEMIRGWLFTGFPWSFLGVSQYQMLPLIQIASVTGVFGVSFLVVWMSLAMLLAAVRFVENPMRRSAWVAEMCLPGLTVAALFNLGFREFRHEPAVSRSLKVVMVQPSIPQTLIWDETGDDERFKSLVQMSEQALASGGDVLVWPESAIPKPLRYSDEILSAVEGLAQRHHVWVILESDDKEPIAGKDGGRDLYYNSSFLITPQGRLVERYCKRKLVIFGEYIPLVRWLPFLRWVTPIDDGYTAGKDVVPFKLTDRGARVSVLICFEDVFPEITRESVDEQTDFLVNLTNDGWFGDGAAQWQHAASAVFRAVENGVPLLRCSNNGLTCWVDDLGRIRAMLHDSSGGVYGRGWLTVQVPLKDPGQARTMTFFHRHGNWFGWGCLVMVVVFAARPAFRRSGGQ